MTSLSSPHCHRALIQRFYPALWHHIQHEPLLRGEWLTTLCALSARERLVIPRLEHAAHLAHLAEQEKAP